MGEGEGGGRQISQRIAEENGIIGTDKMENGYMSGNLECAR